MAIEQSYNFAPETLTTTTPLVPEQLFQLEQITDQVFRTDAGIVIGSISPKSVRIVDPYKPQDYFFIAEIREYMEHKRLHLSAQTHIPFTPRNEKSRPHAIFAKQLFRRSIRHFIDNGKTPTLFQDEWWDDSDSWQMLRTANPNSANSVRQALQDSFSVKCALELGFPHLTFLEINENRPDIDQDLVRVEFTPKPRRGYSIDLTKVEEAYSY